MKKFFAIILCLSLTSCLGISKKDSTSKASRHKSDKGVEMKIPMDEPRADRKDPTLPAMLWVKKWERIDDKNEKDSSESTNISGMLLPAIGIGLLLIAAGLFFLNRQTGGILKRVNQGVVSLWDRFNTKVNLATPGTQEHSLAQEGKAMIESFAAEHNIKI
jgi:hypothetical protein